MLGIIKRQARDAVIVFSKMIPYAGTPIAYRLENKGILGGTIASPDYGYKDCKLKLLEAFLAHTFYFRNYNKHGLVRRLRDAKLDAWILEKYYSSEFIVYSTAPHIISGYEYRIIFKDIPDMIFEVWVDGPYDAELLIGTFEEAPFSPYQVKEIIEEVHCFLEDEKFLL